MKKLVNTQPKGRRVGMTARKQKWYPSEGSHAGMTAKKQK